MKAHAKYNQGLCKDVKVTISRETKKEIPIQLTKRSKGFPSLNKMKVGKASILYLSAILGYFSVSTFTTLIISFRAAPTSLRIGAMN